MRADLNDFNEIANIDLNISALLEPMRPTLVRQLMVGLATFAATLAIVLMIGGESPFLPGLACAVLIAAWVFLLKRYERMLPVRPLDPRRRRLWLWSSMATCGLLAVFGFIAAGWIHEAHLQP